jgi:hypothetical protein
MILLIILIKLGASQVLFLLGGYKYSIWLAYHKKIQKKTKTLKASQNVRMYCLSFGWTTYMKGKTLGKPYGIKLKIVNTLW